MPRHIPVSEMTYGHRKVEDERLTRDDMQLERILPSDGSDSLAVKEGAFESSRCWRILVEPKDRRFFDEIAYRRVVQIMLDSRPWALSNANMYPVTEMSLIGLEGI